jgi:hypothetical protein
MLIPGSAIALLTFPGVMLHEFAHKLFCDVFKIKVRNVCYFRVGTPSGYVEHEQPTNFKQTFLIDIGPFLINTIASLIIFFFARLIEENSPLTWFFLLWLGGSFAVNSFPSTGDAKILWRETNRHAKKNLLAIIGYPVVLLIYIANILSILWFDFLYAGSLYVLTGIIIRVL